MITNEIGNTDTTRFSLSGKSTDSKPTSTFDGKKIANGSTFLEIDTKEVKFYDADTDTWV